MRDFRNFNYWHKEQLQNIEDAKLYLQVSLEEYEQDGDSEAFLLALRNVAEAQGGISELAKRTSLNRQSLYKTLSSRGNPKLDTLGTILHGLGFKLSIDTLENRNL